MYVYIYTIHHILTIYFSRKATQKLFIKMIINYDESDKFFVIVFFFEKFIFQKNKARNSTATAMDGDVFLLRWLLIDTLLNLMLNQINYFK